MSEQSPAGIPGTPDLNMTQDVPVVDVPADQMAQFLDDCQSSASGLMQQAQAAQTGTALGASANLPFLLQQAAVRLATLRQLFRKAQAQIARLTPADPKPDAPAEQPKTPPSSKK